MVLHWTSEQRAAVDAAVGKGRSGTPVTLAITGGPGTGKSALLDELADLAADFQVLDGYGWAGGRELPFDLLGQWNAAPTDSPRLSPMVAAQSLRRRVDELAAAGPVLIRVDDLHEADPESVEALVWLLRRARGDRLLVAAGYRPLGPGQHPAWQRWLDSRATLHRVELTGLTEHQAGELVGECGATLSDTVVHRLWVHTDGNPLYLKALLREHDPAVLATDSVLPAPREYVHVIGDRLDRAGEDARNLAGAVCVLTDGWIALPDAVAVGDVGAPSAAVQQLVDLEVLQHRSAERVDLVRPTHALLRAAVKESLGRPRLRMLNARAAEVVGDAAASLEHRLAAADRYDEQLAGDAEKQAADLHSGARYRGAARLYRSAAALTADRRVRSRRTAEAVINQLLAHEMDISAADLAVLDRIPSGSRLVSALRSVLLGEWAQAYRLLTRAPSDGTAPAALDDDELRIAYRIAVLTAWAGIGSGAATDDLIPFLDRAGDIRRRHPHLADPAFRGYEMSPRGYVQERLDGLAAVAESLAGLPVDAADVPGAETVELARRGVLSLRTGHLRSALHDLGAVERRFRDGVLDITDGGYLARYAQALWCHGDWDRAQTVADLAMADVSRFLQPIAATAVSVLPSSRGDFVVADRLLGRARTFLTAQRWPEGLRSLLVAEVIRLHAGGNPAEQAAYAPTNAALFELLRNSRSLALLEALHACLGLIWSKNLDPATVFADLVVAEPQRPAWAGAVRNWLLGLIAEARRRPAEALELLSGTDTDALGDIPLYQAHIWTDHARLAAIAGASATAGRLATRAAERYRSLGATPYADRSAAAGAQMATVSPARDQWQLSNRERQVLVEAVNGLSYAQIAAELFVTQSTVAFHLSNIYAKTGVSSRHELTAAVRRQPHQFGMAAEATVRLN